MTYRQANFDRFSNGTHPSSLSVLPRLSSTINSVSFRVCTTDRNRFNTAWIEILENITLDQLKWKIYKQFRLETYPTDFCLTVFDERDRTWKSVGEENNHKHIFDLKLPFHSILNVEKREETNANEQHVLTIREDALTLKICKQPMNTSDCEYLTTYPSMTLGQLKKEAQKKVRNQNTDHLFLLTKDGWTKFEPTFDDTSLDQLGFTRYSFISFEERDNVETELILRLCKQPMNRSDCEYITTYSLATLGELKRQAQTEVKSQRTDHLFLLTKDGWMKFEPTSDDMSLDQLGFTSYSVISFEVVEDVETELILKLCKQPMNLSDCTKLIIYSSTTLGQLKKEVQKEIRNKKTDHLFLWKKDGWTKFDPTFDDTSLDQLGFTSHSFISFEARDNAETEWILKLCKQPMNVSDCTKLIIYPSMTLGQLKKVVQKEIRNKKTDHLFLWIQNGWKKFEPTFDDTSLDQLGFTSYSFISFEERDNVETELVLRLCKHPMDISDYTNLTADSSTTLGQLKERAQTEVRNQKTDKLSLWTIDRWIEFETTLHDVSIIELGFTQYSYISFEAKDDFTPGVCGLTNLGNTCFMNSALQCLSNIPKFTQKILSFDTDMNAPIIGGYIELIKTIWSGKHAVTAPSSLLLNVRENLPRFTQYRQHDAQEFMNYFLHLLHQELTNEQTLITDLFYGRIQSNVKCLGGCDFIETNEEMISFLPLPIDNDVNQYNILYLRSNGEQCLVPLRTCVKTIGKLINSFIQKHDPDLSPEQIKAVKIINNRIKYEYSFDTWLTDTFKNQLTLIEVRKKNVDQKYIEFQFADRKTRKAFRPPVFLVRPSYECRYSDISKQIKRIQKHVCSLTDASPSDCYFYWTNDRNENRDFNTEVAPDDCLLFLSRVTMEMDYEWIEKYQSQYSFDRSVNNASLTNLLNDFFREEALDGDYYCSKCLDLKKAEQKASLALPLPHVLIIQLKRFTYDAYSDAKIDTHIDFPLKDLDLSEYINPKPEKNTTLYDLVAVSNHTGSLISGHYTTYAKNYRNNKWYLFNDEITREINNEKDIVTNNAYILIYTKRTV